MEMVENVDRALMEMQQCHEHADQVVDGLLNMLLEANGTGEDAGSAASVRQEIHDPETGSDSAVSD